MGPAWIPEGARKAKRTAVATGGRQGEVGHGTAIIASGTANAGLAFGATVTIRHVADSPECGVTVRDDGSPPATWPRRICGPHWRAMAGLAERYQIPMRALQTSGDLVVAETAHKPDVEQAVALFLGALRKTYAVNEVRLFGSRARGDFRPDSDVDLAVVLHGERGDVWQTAQALANITFDVLGETGVAVSALPLWHDEFDHPERAKNPTLIRNIRRDGIRL